MNTTIAPTVRRYRPNQPCNLFVGYAKLFLAALAILTIALSANPANKVEHNLSIRVLDSDSGKAVNGIYVFLTFPTQQAKIKGLTAKTNSNGIATFRLADSVPERVGISFSADDFGTCSDVQFSTGEALRVGVISACKDQKFKYTSPAKPAQIVVFGKKVTLSQRIRREIP